MKHWIQRPSHGGLGAGLLALCATFAGCSDDSPATQVVIGQLSEPTAVAVRAVDDHDVVTAAQVRQDGRFTLALPTGNYRVEVLTADGVKHLYVHGASGLHDLAFRVCKPSAPWDIGTVIPPVAAQGGGTAGCDPTKDLTCACDASGVCNGGGDSPGCDPTDPTCGGGGAPGCDPSTDPCKCDPTCGGGGGDPGCDPSTGTTCGGGAPGCDPSTDPYCKCSPDDASSCVSICDDPSGTACPPPPPAPCEDPSNAERCKDPCAIDPQSCGCASDDPTCWGDPSPPKCDAAGNCSANGALTPEHPPVDFGCTEPT